MYVVVISGGQPRLNIPIMDGRVSVNGSFTSTSRRRKKCSSG